MFKYNLGIIGGMGSEATVEIYKRIVERTVHSCDQDHMKICILNNSIIPDRTKCIIEGAESPLPHLNKCIKELEMMNVEYFIVACNTAHYFAPFFEMNSIKFINMIEESLNFIKENYKNKKVCVLGTKGTLETRVYHNNEQAKAIEFVYANDIEQDIIMSVITDTKADEDRIELTNRLLSVVRGIKEREEECVFLIACTELSLYKKVISEYALVIDAMDCLVESAINKCGYKLK